jgi:hypothetical protein
MSKRRSIGESTDWRLRAYAIIGRTDGAHGETGSIDLPEDLSAAISKRFYWHRFDGRPVRLYRGGQLVVQGEGPWLEGWTRDALYRLLGLRPWNTGPLPTEIATDREEGPMDPDILSEIYQEATGDDPTHRDDEQRCLIAEEMQAVIDAPTEAQAVRIISFWGHGAEEHLRIVRKVRRLAAGTGKG